MLTFKHWFRDLRLTVTLKNNGYNILDWWYSGVKQWKNQLILIEKYQVLTKDNITWRWKRPTFINGL